MAGVEGFMALSGTPNFVVYLLLGAFYWNFVEVVWSVALSVQRALRSGVLEALWVTPIPRLGLLLGWSLARMLVVVPTFLGAAALILAFGGVPGAWVLLEAALVILVSALGSYGFAFLLVGLTLRLKDADSVVQILGNAAPLLGGVFFPVLLLPEPLRALSFLFPFTYGAELLRAAWFGSSAFIPKPLGLGFLAGLSMSYLLLGWAALQHLEKKARAHGLEGF